MYNNCYPGESREAEGSKMLTRKLLVRMLNRASATCRMGKKQPIIFLDEN